MEETVVTETQQDSLITPKFLTVPMARSAIHGAFTLVFGPGGCLWSLPVKPIRTDCHVVILVPGMTDHRAEDYPDWPAYPTKPVCLYEESRGDPSKFKHPFANIARCKALQLWTDRNDGRTGCIPHLLFPGDTPWWGGVKRHGLVAACSGLQPHLDQLIAGIVVDSLVALAHEAWLASPDQEQRANFLT